MIWDGKERRQAPHDCAYQNKIIEIGEDVASTKATVIAMDRRINGSIDDFVNHIEHGHKWRATIVTVATVVVLEVIAFSFMFGKVSEAVGTLKTQHRVQQVQMEK